MGRVLTNELIRLIDGRFRFLVLVIRVHQVELALTRGIRKRKARLELLVVDRRIPVIAGVGGALGAFVENVGVPELLAGLVAAPGQGQQHQRRGQSDDSHAKILRKRSVFTFWAASIAEQSALPQIKVLSFGPRPPWKFPSVRTHPT